LARILFYGASSKGCEGRKMGAGKFERTIFLPLFSCPQLRAFAVTTLAEPQLEANGTTHSVLPEVPVTTRLAVVQPIAIAKQSHRSVIAPSSRTNHQAQAFNGWL
jgi:hypothetical protein